MTKTHVYPHPSYNTRGPEEPRKPRTTYRVSNSAGGTELVTTSKARALARFNSLQFPGEVYRVSPTGIERALELELVDYQWQEVRKRIQ